MAKAIGGIFDLLINAVINKALTTKPDVPQIVSFTGNPDEFVKAIWPLALQVQMSTGLNALVLTTQGALESGWGKKSPGGNSFFGIKADSNWTGDKVKAITTEHKKPSVPASQIISAGPPVWKIWDYFRAYKTLAEAVTDYGKFFQENGRYAKVFSSTNPVDQAKALAAAGYSTSASYINLLLSTLRGVQNRVTKFKLPTA